MNNHLNGKEFLKLTGMVGASAMFLPSFAIEEAANKGKKALFPVLLMTVRSELNFYGLNVII